jgi:small-conductance mechanosensitive channel
MPKSKSKSDKDPFIKLRILQKKLGAGNETVKIKREREFRKLMRSICAVLCLASFIPAALLLTWFDHFTVDNLTPVLLETVQLLLVGAIISGVLLFVLSVIERKSAVRETEQTKIAISSAEKSDKRTVKNNKNNVKITRLVFVGIACVLIVIGLTQDGFYDVLQKAIRICTECIGLG